MNNIAYLPGHQPQEAPQEGASQSRGPQVEEGYTRIANELYEVVNNAHACPVTLTQLRLIHAVIRRTYGFNKKMDAVADTQLAADTGIPRQKVNPAKHALIAMKVLVLSEDGRKIGVNKRYSEWDFSARPEKKAPQRKAQPDGDTVTKKVTQDVTKTGTHKRQKDILTTDVVSSAPKKQNRIDFSEFEDRVDLETLKAFADHRKAMRKPLTQRALRSVVKKAVEAAEQVGITIDQAFDEALASGWLKVEAEWLINRGYGKSNGDPSIPECPHAEILAEWNQHLASRKGRAPAAADWEGTRMAAKLSELWAKNWNAKNPSGVIRYSTVEEGIAWWSRVFQHLAGNANFMQSDVTLSNLFNPDTFALAVNGNLRQNGGAAR